MWFLIMSEGTHNENNPVVIYNTFNAIISMLFDT